MQEHSQPRFSDKFIEQLFNLYGSSYLGLLSKWGLVKYLQVEEFYNYLHERVGEECQGFIQKIRAKINQEASLNPHFDFHIPTIPHTQDQRSFQRNKLRIFITILSFSQNDDQYFEQYVPNAKLEDDESSDQEDDGRKNYYHFSFKDKGKKHSIEKVKQDQAVNAEPLMDFPENKVKKIPSDHLFPFINNFMLQNSQSQDSQKQQNRQKIKMIPLFLTNCQKALNQLLQLDLTRQFKKQLDDIRGLFRDRLLKSRKFTEFYIGFMNDYLMINTIREGQCDKGFVDEKITKKKLKKYFERYLHEQNYQIKYCLKIKNGPLTQIWDKIRENLRPIMERKTFDIQKKVLEIMHRGINKIFITFSGQKRIYGKTMYGQIYINVNQKNQEQKLEQYRQGTMKSYITLVILHEITHYLIREYKGCQIKETDVSFQSSNDSIGNQILRWMKIRSMNGNRDYLSINKQKFTKEQVEKASGTFKNIVTAAYNFIMTYEAVFSKLNQKKDEFERIKQKVSIVDKVTRATYRYINLTRFESSFQSIFHYIDSLAASAEEKIQEQLLDESSTKQTQYCYTFFFNIFRIQYVAFQWRNQLGLSEAAYNKYVECLDKLNEKGFYNGRNPFIDEFIGKISKWIQFDEVCLHFNQLCLNSKRLIEDINSQIMKFKDFINADDSRQLISVYTKRLQPEIQQIFPLFQAKRRYQFGKIMVSCIEDITDYCTVETIYNMLMRLIKYSEQKAIVLQLPNVFSTQAPKFQAGYIMERQLFPLFNEKIYAKDFQLFHEPEDSGKWGEIGVAPASQEQLARHSIVQRKNDRQKDIGINMRNGCCYHLILGDQKRRLEAIKQQKRQRRQNLKRLSKEKIMQKEYF